MLNIVHVFIVAILAGLIYFGHASSWDPALVAVLISLFVLSCMIRFVR